MYPELPRAAAGDLATGEPRAVRAGADPGVALEWLRSERFAAAPVRETDGTLVGYVATEALGAVADAGGLAERVDAHADPIEEAPHLPADAEFGTVTDTLAAEPFCFVGDRENPGLLTRADLNRPAAYVHLYALLFEFETRLRSRISAADVDWEDRLYPDQLEEVDERDDRQEGFEPPRIHYLSVPMLAQVVQRTDRLRSELELGDQQTARECLERIVALRNDVFHPKDLVHTQETAAFSGRDAIALAELYDRLRELVDRLAELTERDEAGVPRPEGETPPAVWTPQSDPDGGPSEEPTPDNGVDERPAEE